MDISSGSVRNNGINTKKDLTNRGALTTKVGATTRRASLAASQQENQSQIANVPTVKPTVYKTSKLSAVDQPSLEVQPLNDTLSVKVRMAAVAAMLDNLPVDLSSSKSDIRRRSMRMSLSINSKGRDLTASDDSADHSSVTLSAEVTTDKLDSTTELPVPERRVTRSRASMCPQVAWQ
jgi:hypothetical protein